MTETPDRDTLLRKAYTIATQRLREQYPDDFNTHRGEAAAELGLDWTPRLSQEEKAKKELLRLLAENPSLMDVLDSLPPRTPSE